MNILYNILSKAVPQELHLVDNSRRERSDRIELSKQMKTRVILREYSVHEIFNKQY